MGNTSSFSVGQGEEMPWKEVTVMEKRAEFVPAGEQRFVLRFALGGDVGEEVFLLGEAALQFFELRQQAGQGVVAFFRRVGQPDGVFQALSEKLVKRISEPNLDKHSPRIIPSDAKHRRFKNQRFFARYNPGIPSRPQAGHAP
jgi:hypothetical protein